MSTVQKLERSPLAFMSNKMKCVIAIIVACTLAITVMLAGGAASSEMAYAATGQSSASAQSATAKAASAQAASGEEAIEDDENPMSSGLDSAELASPGGVPIYAIVSVGIVAVAAFFLVSTRKQNASITKMIKTFR